MAKSIDNFLDSNGKLKQLLAKQAMRMLAYDYLAGNFEKDVEYSEAVI